MKRINFLPPPLKRQTVRNLAALVVCMFCLAVTGCNKDEFDESEIFRTRGWILSMGDCGWQILDQRSVLKEPDEEGRVTLGPVAYRLRNLTREFQVNELEVNILFGYRRGDRYRCDWLVLPEITILEIEKVVYTSRFYVRKTGDFGYLLFEDFGNPEFDRIVKPSYLPEEFRQDGLQVDITFRELWETLPLYEDRQINPIEIISIMETPEAFGQTRITGGDPTLIEDNPWQVFISLGILDTDRRGCGGTIIAPNLILTARHCVNINPHPSSFNVHAGITCRADINSSNTFQVSRIIFHPNPNVDIALLQLSSNIPFNNNRRAVNFLSSTNTALFGTGSRVTATGWGGTVAGLDGYLQRMAECLQTVDLTVWEVSPQLIRASDTQSGRQGGCYGDSGGPLIIRTASNEPVLIGVTHKTYQRCVGSTYFKRVDQIVPWIRSTASTLPTALPISGTPLLCSSSATFTVTAPPGAVVNWISSPNLRHIGGGTFSVIHPSGAQGSWVQAIVNYHLSQIHYFWAGTPFVSGVRVISTTHTGNSTIRRFTAEFPEIQRTMINPTGWRWELDAPSCCARFVGNTNREAVDIQFNGGGFFDLTVAATNACGVGTPHWAMIYYFGRSDGMRESTAARAQSRPISGAFHVLLGYEVDARMQRYDVRIYDSAGNMIKQVIAENGRAEFDLSDLPGGNYYLHICDGVDEPMIQPIVVENRS